MTTKHTSVIVADIPTCDIHLYAENPSELPAVADGKTVFGRWAYMCESCFERYGVGLGTGLGQRLILRAPDDTAQHLG